MRGWARSVSVDAAEGISWIEDGIREYRAPGAMLGMPFYLAVKAEALYLADRVSDALDAIREAEVLADKFEVRWWSAELRRMRGVLFTAIGAKETEIDTSFCEAIGIAKGQKSISLQKRAEATYAEYFNLGSPERRSRQWYKRCHQRALHGTNRLQAASYPAASVRY
jgi:hypothetical protein